MTRFVTMAMTWFVVAATAAAAAEEEEERNVMEAAKANNDFCFDLTKALGGGAGGDNVFFSPLSISAALAMTSLGARSRTLDELKRSLHFDGVVDTSADQSALHRAYRKLFEKYSGVNSDYTLEIANRLFGSQSLGIKDDFQSAAGRFYKGELQKVDFSSGTAEGIINRWVSEKTHDKIKDLFKPNSLDDKTLLVLVNAIYFKGNWKEKFDKDHTAKDRFYLQNNREKTVDMMSMKSDFIYSEDRDLQAKVLYLPYTGEGVEMMIVLPNSVDGLPRVLGSLERDKLNSLATHSSGGRMRKVNVKLPKFKLETEYALRAVLQKLGITELFSMRANLSGISTVPSYVSAVQHKAFVEVNEEGTEAAAATGIVTNVKSAGPKSANFVVDRPFYFAIVDATYGNILFSGAVYDP